MRPRTAFLIFLVLAVGHTWPLATAPGRLSLNHNADAQLNTWTISWIAHTLPRDPSNLFNGNIFAPEPNTLSYTDPLIAPALAGAPVRWLGGSPVLAFNVSLILGLALTGWATWIGARRWTGSDGAALVAGSLAAFNPHLLTRLPHIVAAWSWTIPLSVYLADRLIDERRPRTAVLLALTVAATAANSLYALAFVGIIVGLVMAAAAAMRRWQSVVWIGASSVAGLIVAVPVLLPYVKFAATGVVRPLSSVEQFSATLSGYLNSASRVHAGWSAPFFDRDVSVFFAGFTAIALALVGLAATRGPRSARHRIILATMAIIGVVLSLGPSTAIYRALYEWLTPLQGLRAAARFGYLYLIAVAFAAAFGVAWLQQRISSPRARNIVAAGALALVTAEAWSAPVYVVPFDGVPAIYREIATLPEPVVLVEMPFYPPEGVFENGEYVLNATAHWRPLMNGYSGFTPLSYRRRAEFLWYFPEPRALDRLKDEGATHVMVHLERFPAHEVPELQRALREQTVMTLVASDTRGHRLYKLR